MKKFLIILICVSVIPVLSGCGKSTFSEAEYQAVMQYYYSREFEESFYEKQSSAQRGKLLKESVNKYKVDFNSFLEFMKKNHPEMHAVIL